MSVTVTFSGCGWRESGSTEADNPILAVGKAHEPISILDPSDDWTVLKTSHYVELSEK